jgi:DnaJ-class molecular chaperone
MTEPKTPGSLAAAGQRQEGGEASPGAPQTAENICRACGGTGRVDGKPCPECGGTGKVIETVGDA